MGNGKRQNRISLCSDIITVCPSGIRQRLQCEDAAPSERTGPFPPSCESDHQQSAIASNLAVPGFTRQHRTIRRRCASLPVKRENISEPLAGSPMRLDNLPTPANTMGPTSAGPARLIDA
ncbi:hypothetical protein R84981_002226 [Carnimonas sp. R-84981]